MNRRELLTAIGFSTAAMAAGGASTLGATDVTTDGRFRVFDVRQFGATGDGKTLDTAAINRAIEMAAGGGGGTVYVPPGVYLVGTVVLKSNITLYLEAGST